MGSEGNLVFSPSEVTISAGDTITFVNGDLPPHNMMVEGHPELSHSDLAFSSGDSFDVTFPDPCAYSSQTIKMGIEKKLMMEIPDVAGVIQVL